MTVDELIKAAYEIQEICQANGRTCKGCPFSYVFYGETYCKGEEAIRRMAKLIKLYSKHG